MHKIVIRRIGDCGYVADLHQTGWPVFPLVAWISTRAEVEVGIARYVREHRDAIVVRAS